MISKLIPLAFILGVLVMSYCKYEADKKEEQARVINYIRELNNTNLNEKDKIIIKQIKEYEKGVDTSKLKGKTLKEKQDEYRKKSYDQLNSVFE